MDSEPTSCSPSEPAARALMRPNTPPEMLGFCSPDIFPPHILAEAEKCADPRRYLVNWLKIQRNELEIKSLHGKFILENWESLKQAGYTPKQLEDAAESGEDFDQIMREVIIQDMIHPGFRDAVKKLKRFHAVLRFPLDFMGLDAARRAVADAAKLLPTKARNGTAEFLPNTEGRIEICNNKWRKLSPAEIAAIEASRDAALERTFTLSPGARDEFAQFDALRDSYSIPAYLKAHVNPLEPCHKEILNAVVKGDLDFFVRLGECLKKAKTVSKKAAASFIKRFQRQRLALFLIEHWLPSPRLRGTWLYQYLSNPNHFAKAEVHLSPLWLSSGALLVTLGERQAAKQSKTPGLCFLGDAALVRVCNSILNARFKKHTVNKTIKRLGLKKCRRTELIFTQVEESNGTFLASSPRRAK